MARAANYLLERKLGWKKSTGEPINTEWSTPIFPRFYEYDLLRGLTAVARWAEKTVTKLPAESLNDAITALDSYFTSGAPVRRSHLQSPTMRQDATGGWVKEAAASFPLLART